MYHGLMLISNGNVFSCGRNIYGELGRETNENYSASFDRITTLSDIKRIDCGNIHSMCINSTDDLYIFGGNEFGQLGLDDFIDRGKPIKHPSLSNVIDISSGGCSTFVKTSNEIYAFGLNEY